MGRDEQEIVVLASEALDRAPQWMAQQRVAARPQAAQERTAPMDVVGRLERSLHEEATAERHPAVAYYPRERTDEATPARAELLVGEVDLVAVHECRARIVRDRAISLAQRLVRRIAQEAA